MTIEGMTPRSQRGEVTRNHILQVARRLFSEYGFAATGLSDIQKATGLTRGAFYHHFHGKEDLALATLELARRDYQSLWSEPIPAAYNGSERLLALLDSIVALNERPDWRNSHLLAMLTAESDTASDRLREAICSLYDELVNVWQQAIQEAQQAHEASPAFEAQTMAAWLMASLTGLSLAHKLGRDRATIGPMVTLIKNLLSV